MFDKFRELIEKKNGLKCPDDRGSPPDVALIGWQRENYNPSEELLFAEPFGMGGRSYMARITWRSTNCLSNWWRGACADPPSTSCLSNWWRGDRVVIRGI